jgi:hypothetical protein
MRVSAGGEHFRRTTINAVIFFNSLKRSRLGGYFQATHPNTPRAFGSKDEPPQFSNVGILC